MSGDDGTVVLGDVKDIFAGLVKKWEKGDGARWAERSDTYMYLTCMHAAGWDTDYFQRHSQGAPAHVGRRIRQGNLRLARV